MDLDPELGNADHSSLDLLTPLSFVSVDLLQVPHNLH